MSEIDWKQRAEKAEAACAEMRGVLKDFEWIEDGVVTWPTRDRLKHALSSDCGKGYIPAKNLTEEWKGAFELFHKLWGLNHDGVYRKPVWCELLTRLESLRKDQSHD